MEKLKKKNIRSNQQNYFLVLFVSGIHLNSSQSWR
jgi:hypothetical protein